MIFVTHDQVEAMTLADRIVVMNNQRIEQIGTPMEIYSRPATRIRRELRRHAGDEFRSGRADRRHTRFATVSACRTVRRSTRASPRRSLPAAQLSALGIRAESARVCAAGRGHTARHGEVRRAARRPHAGLCRSWRTARSSSARMPASAASRSATPSGCDSIGARCASVRRRGAAITPPTDAELAERYGCAAPIRSAPAARRSWSGTLCSCCRILAVYALLLVYPLFAGMWLSLHKADLFGARALRRAARTSSACSATRCSSARVWNTFYFVFLTVPALALIGLALALALNRTTRTARVPARRLLRVLGAVGDHRHADLARGVHPGRRLHRRRAREPSAGRRSLF